MNPIDRFLNNTTMYRVVAYALIAMAACAVVLGFTNVISYGGLQQLASLVIVVAACRVSNVLFARLRNVPANNESWLITGLILFFLVTPVNAAADAVPLLLAGVIAMASKYVIAPHGKHLFNPAALAATVLGVLQIGDVSWWIGTPSMLPITIIGGFLIVRKIRRFPLVLTCLVSSFIVVSVLGMQYGMPVWESLLQHLSSWPIIFFATVMVTEPLTMPPRRNEQIAYGLLIGALSSWPFVLGPFYTTPEMVLLLGNLFAYSVSLRRRLTLRLKEKREVARGTWEYVFGVDPPLRFRPGQYLEWTLPHEHADDRGNRRYFTIASSPTEPDLHLGVRIGNTVSTFKQRLKDLQPGDTLLAGQLAGDFTLPKNPAEKLVFMAGGIGVTPFRSMVKDLVDRKEKRDIVLFYANREPADAAYRDLFDEAANAVGLKTVYVFGGSPIDAARVAEQVPDYKDRTFYLSGPSGMVDAYKAMLSRMHVHRNRIVTDYFPGFA